MSRLLFATRHAFILVIVAMAGTAVLAAQQNTPSPATVSAFSMKPAAPYATSRFSTSATTADRSHLQIPSITVLTLVSIAYQLDEDQIQAPAWMHTSYVSVSASADPPLSVEAKPNPRQAKLDCMVLFVKLLQPQIAQSFQIHTHEGVKVAPVYALQVASGGIKMAPATTLVGLHWLPMNGKNEITRGAVPMPYLAAMLQMTSDRPIVDETKLEGLYQVGLTWADDGVAAESLGDALKHQLGLALVAKNVERKQLIIDAAVPPAN